MKNSTFGDHFLLVRGSCLISRLSSLLSVSEGKRTTLPRAGTGPVAGATAGLCGTPGPQAGGQDADQRSGPGVQPLCGWTGHPEELWSGDDEVGGDGDDEWPGSATRHQALATNMFSVVRSHLSSDLRSLAPATVPSAQTNRPHGSDRSFARSASLALCYGCQRL